ncbi:MAG TPA: RHS repeat-associated core domain-containing protein [Terriglobales bacterium]|nr:RHS repeat-associated core domain-containing protein [Terriglobales bacterium]
MSTSNSTFVYDRWGNLTQATGAQNWNVSFNGANQVAGFSYDSDGRLTNDGSAAYSWDDLNEMTGYNSSSTSSYDYDPLGRRSRSATPSGSFDYLYGVGGSLRGVWSESAGGWSRLEIGVAGLELETYDASPPSGYSAFTYNAVNALGSESFRYNAGAGALNYHYLPFGLGSPGQGSDPTTNLHWTGQEQDGESGLYHFRYRNYSPLESRWLSPDPAGWAAADPADPQSFNRYSYAGKSPCSATDPLGLANCPPGYHVLTAREATDVVAAAAALARQTNLSMWKCGEGGNEIAGTRGHPNPIDCTHFIHLAIQDAGLWTPYENTAQMARFGGSLSYNYYLPDPTPGGQVGDVVVLDAGGGFATHAVLIGGTNPLKLYASNEHRGYLPPGGPQRGVGGPQEVGDSWWTGRANSGLVLRPCVKLALPPSRVEGGGGGPIFFQPTGAAGQWRFDWWVEFGTDEETGEPFVIGLGGMWQWAPNADWRPTL